MARPGSPAASEGPPLPARTLLAGLAAGLTTALIGADPAAAAGEPAGGAAAGQVIAATLGATVASAGLVWMLARHRAGKGGLLRKLGAYSKRVSGLPAWAALPSALATVALLIALVGMYWDIALHIGQGRDEGPLANPAHYLILAGLFGVFAAGCMAIALPVGERPGPAPVRIMSGWYAPVGGVLMAAAGAFALTGFPLDDVWHRLFGQDVTLWGPTHLMLIGGAGLTLVGQALLLAEGMRSRPTRYESTAPALKAGPQLVTYLRRVGLMGGLLIGCSTFQAEFDFGVPQFSFLFQPMLVALAAGIALVAARVWIGRGGAIGAALFFLIVRGGVSLLVGPVLGETTPALPLYLGEALCIEAAALVLGLRRPLVLGFAGGFLAGTVGFWSEWAWSQAVMPLSWNGGLLPEGLLLSALAGPAGGLIGALLGTGLRGELPRPAVARATLAVALAAVAGIVANGIVTEEPGGVRAQVALTDVRTGPQREALASVRIDPPEAAADASWVSITSWQGGGLVVDRLERTGPGRFRSTEPIPVHGEWKSILRLHRGRALLGVPVFLPEDRAIPAPEIPALPRFTRPFSDETAILQRELKDDVPGWLWAAASMVVLAFALAFVAALSWGIARVGRRAPVPPRQERPPVVGAPTPVGARP
jgi:hypothetical protein